METGSPQLPPSPLAEEAPQTAAGVRLPWSTLAYGAAFGAAAGPLGKLATYAVVVHSPVLRVVPASPPSPPAAIDLAQDALSGAVAASVACLALVAADRVAASWTRWMRWGLALGIVGLMPALVFVPFALSSAQPARNLGPFLPGFAGALSAMGGAGALMGLVARARGGLLWKLPVAALAAALASPAADALATAMVVSPRAASVGLSPTSLGVDWLAYAPNLAAVALAVALGLRAARRKAGAAGQAPTEA